MSATQKQLQQMNAGIAEIQSSIDESTNPHTKERLEAILARRQTEKRELESKLSVQLNVEKQELEEVNDQTMLHNHLRRSIMSGAEKSSFIRQHGMENYLKLKL